MEQAPKIENKELKKISKIHFLIHPGWVSADNPEYARLLGGYVEQAQTLHGDELMIAFLGWGRVKLKADMKEEMPYTRYTHTIKDIKDILGDRLIVITDGFNILSSKGSKKALEAVKRTAEVRGYVFDSQVQSEAYGEIFEDCVLLGAENLNKAAGLEHKTVVRSERSHSVVPEEKEAQKKLAKSFSQHLDIE